MNESCSTKAVDTIENILTEILLHDDYDSGLLNSFGGGNVDWWFDYIRHEINRCNAYWREIVESYRRE